MKNIKKTVINFNKLYIDSLDLQSFVNIRVILELSFYKKNVSFDGLYIVEVVSAKEFSEPFCTYTFFYIINTTYTSITYLSASLCCIYTFLPIKKH